ncbi:MAG: hypothetical protein PVF74_09900, partial [Anaerolineales bacterium]
EISFNPEKISEEEIVTKLDEAGYVGELPIPEETPAESAATGNGRKGFFRHTAAFETTNHVVSFGQTVSYEGRALWPCPGMEPITSMEEED